MPVCTTERKERSVESVYWSAWYGMEIKKGVSDTHTHTHCHILNRYFHFTFDTNVQPEKMPY